MAAPAFAKELITVTSLKELRAAIQYAHANTTPFIVLGEGSNTVFVGDYAGLVIRVALKGIELVMQDSESVTVKVQAGENWHTFVEQCVANEWHGLENLALIPGTVGAAPIQNIGAYGVEVKDRIYSVDVLDVDSAHLETVCAVDCDFAYRESRFKHEWAGNKIVTAVTFSLHKSPKSLVLSYPALEQRLQKLTSADGTSVISPKDIFNAVVALRSEKLPLPKDIPNSGSFFKNPVVNEATHKQLIKRHPGLVSFAFAKDYKLAAAWLIESAGWKNKKIDGIQVHRHQALVITNPHAQDGVAIEHFARLIQNDIKERFDVWLEIEPRLIKGISN